MRSSFLSKVWGGSRFRRLRQVGGHDKYTALYMKRIVLYPRGFLRLFRSAVFLGRTVAVCFRLYDIIVVRSLCAAVPVVCIATVFVSAAVTVIRIPGVTISAARCLRATVPVIRTAAVSISAVRCLCTAVSVIRVPVISGLAARFLRAAVSVIRVLGISGSVTRCLCAAVSVIRAFGISGATIPVVRVTGISGAGSRLFIPAFLAVFRIFGRLYPPPFISGVIAHHIRLQRVRQDQFFYRGAEKNGLLPHIFRQTAEARNHGICAPRRVIAFL